MSNRRYPKLRVSLAAIIIAAATATATSASIQRANAQGVVFLAPIATSFLQKSYVTPYAHTFHSRLCFLIVLYIEQIRFNYYISILKFHR